MEGTLPKLLMALVAIGVGYMVYQKSRPSPPPVQVVAVKKQEETPPVDVPRVPPVVEPRPEITSPPTVAALNEPIPAAAPSPRQADPMPRTVDVNDVGAVPLPNPNTQRRAYHEFLSKRNPRAFAICTDGKVLVLAGNAQFITRQLAEERGRCSAYAIDDTVVWAGK